MGAEIFRERRWRVGAVAYEVAAGLRGVFDVSGGVLVRQFREGSAPQGEKGALG